MATTMPARTLKALKASIAHWKRHAEGKAKKGEGIGADDCPLCHLFNRETCHGCPVRARTDLDLCVDSPWSGAAQAERLKMKKGGVAAFHAAARKEYKFLKSLLPKPKAKLRKKARAKS